ncbi:MAG TPA: peroxiredoxin family protein [Mycobacterium sp.]
MGRTSIKSTRRQREASQMQRLGGHAAWRQGWIIGGAMVAVLVVSLYLVYQGSPGKHGATAGRSGFKHVVGQPGPGSAAPAFTLTSGTGGQVSLTAFRGRNVLLYFQEGLSCQPCWDQIKDLEQNRASLKTAGVDAMLSITTDPANLIGRKASDEKLTTPVLSDPSMQVSRAYSANQYGMMGEMRDGHSFILVGPDERIRWRADYGGRPDYTMFLPTAKMLADLTAERTA